MGGGGDILEEEPLEVRVAFISYPQWTLCYAVRSGSRRPPLHPRVSVFRLPTARAGGRGANAASQGRAPGLDTPRTAARWGPPRRPPVRLVGN